MHLGLWLSSPLYYGHFLLVTGDLFYIGFQHDILGSGRKKSTGDGKEQAGGRKEGRKTGGGSSNL